MSSSSNAQALQVALSHLAGALTYTEPTNIETNKKLWNEYASNYASSHSSEGAPTAAAAAASGAPPSEWVLEMASHVQRGAGQLEFLGDEWSDDASLTQSLNHFLFPYLGVDTLTAAEWAESRATEALIAQRAQSAPSAPATGGAFGPECSGGSIPLVNHLPPSSLQAWCAAQAASAPSSSGLVVGELGVGGGRVAGRVYPHVRQLFCFDIAEKMLRQAQKSIVAKHQRRMGADAAAPTATVGNSADAAVTPAVASSASSTSTPAAAVAAAAADANPVAASSAASSASAVGPSHVSFHLLTAAPSFPPRLHGSLDLLYCFDVMPHVDLHTIGAYFRSIRAMLRPADEGDDDDDGPSAGAQVARRRPPPRAFLHTANVCAPLGWERFSRQSRCTAGGFYFLSPDIVRQLARQHGYRIVQESRWTVATPAPAHGHDHLPAAAGPNTGNLYYQRDFLFVLEVI